MKSTTRTSSAQPRDPIVPFGKFKGSKLSQLPHDYLMWLALLPDLRQPLLGGVLAEMAHRLSALDRQTALTEDAEVPR